MHACVSVFVRRVSERASEGMAHAHRRQQTHTQTSEDSAGRVNIAAGTAPPRLLPRAWRRAANSVRTLSPRAEATAESSRSRPWRLAGTRARNCVLYWVCVGVGDDRKGSMVVVQRRLLLCI